MARLHKSNVLLDHLRVVKKWLPKETQNKPKMNRNRTRQNTAENQIKPICTMFYSTTLSVAKNGSSKRHNNPKLTETEHSRKLNKTHMYNVLLDHYRVVNNGCLKRHK